MKKFGIVVVIILVSLSGYHLYREFKEPKNVDLWSLVPEHSLLIFESNNPANVYNRIIKTKVGETLIKINEVDQFNSNLNLLDTLSSKKGVLGELLNGKFLLSVHKVSKNKLGFTYYKSLDNLKQKESFTRLIDIYKKKSSYSFNTRKYQGKLIYEVANSDNNEVLSYFLEENTLVASFTPFLVEDVIRLLDQSENFKTRNEALFKLPRLSNDEGNVFINTKKIDQILSVFSDGDPVDFQIAKASFLDLNIDDNGIFFNGFTEFQNDQLAAVFNNQKPVATNLKYFVPNSTCYIKQFSFNNPADFYTKLLAFMALNDKSYSNNRREFLKKYAQSDDLGFNWIANNIAVAQLETQKGQLVFVECSDVNEGLNQLNTFGESIAQAEGDSVYVENYADYEIRELKADNYVKYKILPFMKDMHIGYYTVFESYIVFSNTIQNLKSLINDIDTENTWGRSVNYNRFLDRTMEESNLTLIVNTDRFLESREANFDPAWADFIAKNSQPLKSFNLISMQLSKLDDNFYSSIVIGHNERKESVGQNFEIAQQAYLDSKAITKPFVVKNHISNLREVVLLDSANNLVLIGNNGQILWEKPINGEVVSAIQQIDFYNNNKLQYFFTTKNAIHIVDRNGNYIDNYPLKVDEQIAYANIVDYDNSKRYRLLTADERGNIYLRNKEGQLLNEWTPRKLEAPLISTPFHIRIRRKDCFVAFLNNGSVALLNRRGEYLDGFPLEFDVKIKKGVHIKVGSDFSSTIFTIVSRDGRLIQFNMNGEVVETNQLYKPTKDSEFNLISDELGKGFIIVRRDLNRVVLLNEELNEVLAKDYFDAEEMLVQYYYFSPSNKLYAITDKIQGFTYLYNNNGDLINSRPVNSDFEVGVLYSEVRDDLKVYCVANNEFKILQFK